MDAWLISCSSVHRCPCVTETNHFHVQVPCNIAHPQKSPCPISVTRTGVHRGRQFAAVVVFCNQRVQLRFHSGELFGHVSLSRIAFIPVRKGAFWSAETLPRALCMKLHSTMVAGGFAHLWVANSLAVRCSEVGTSTKPAPSSKKGGFRAAFFIPNLLILRIAGEGFEPPTFGL
jgi:hypothetical protein